MIQWIQTDRDIQLLPHCTWSIKPVLLKYVSLSWLVGALRQESLKYRKYVPSFRLFLHKTPKPNFCVWVSWLWVMLLCRIGDRLHQIFIRVLRTDFPPCLNKLSKQTVPKVVLVNRAAVNVPFEFPGVSAVKNRPVAVETDKERERCRDGGGRGF